MFSCTDAEIFEAKICKANHTQLVAHEKNAFFHNPADHFHLAAMALDMQKKLSQQSTLTIGI
jgi:hypothetical protein